MAQMTGDAPCRREPQGQPRCQHTDPGMRGIHLALNRSEALGPGETDPPGSPGTGSGVFTVPAVSSKRKDTVSDGRTGALSARIGGKEREEEYVCHGFM